MNLGKPLKKWEVVPEKISTPANVPVEPAGKPQPAQPEHADA